ncbi:MAG: thiamine-phosphate kinase [bacterium]
MATLQQLGELEIIRRLCANRAGRPDVLVGAGDDCAVVRTGDPEFDLLLKTDAVIEGTHFLADTPPEKIGHKAVGRVVSDFAAMGGEPQHLLIDLVAPGPAEFDRVAKIYEGAARFGLPIIGGGTASGPVLELHVFGSGRVPRDKALLRSAARPGDLVYVTGSFGGSRAGKHLDFEPRLREGRWLRESGFVHAMIDVSDGLVTDLRHVAHASGTGATLMEDGIPVSDVARAMKDDRAPIDHALYDGEDFELLFTIAQEEKQAFEGAWGSAHKLPCTQVGYITPATGRLTLLTCDGHDVELAGGGYEHFRAAS